MEDRLETCKNCRWWEPHASEEGRELYAKHNNPSSPQWVCQHPKMMSRSCREAADAMSSYDDVFTGPDFGCIHWQVKLPF